MSGPFLISTTPFKGTFTIEEIRCAVGGQCNSRSAGVTCLWWWGFRMRWVPAFWKRCYVSLAVCLSRQHWSAVAIDNNLSYLDVLEMDASLFCQSTFFEGAATSPDTIRNIYHLEWTHAICWVDDDVSTKSLEVTHYLCHIEKERLFTIVIHLCFQYLYAPVRSKFSDGAFARPLKQHQLPFSASELRHICSQLFCCSEWQSKVVTGGNSPT